MEGKIPGQKKIFRWGPALFLMVGIFIFSSIPGDGFPSWTDILDLLVSKGGHMFGYGLLAAAYLHALGGTRASAYRIAWISAVLYGMTDEFHQGFVPGRMPSVVDVGIDALGALSGLLVWRYFQKKQDR